MTEALTPEERAEVERMLAKARCYGLERDALDWYEDERHMGATVAEACREPLAECGVD